jgi:hypothetical protein
LLDETNSPGPDKTEIRIKSRFLIVQPEVLGDRISDSRANSGLGLEDQNEYLFIRLSTPLIVTSNCGINRLEIRGRNNVRVLALNDTRHLSTITGNDACRSTLNAS